MGRTRVGAAALIVGVGLAIVGLGLYQAWWTVVFPIGGAVAYWLDRSGAQRGRTIAIGGAVAGALALGGMGFFLVVMSPRSCARPPCAEGVPPLLIVGVAAIVVSLVAIGLLAGSALGGKLR